MNGLIRKIIAVSLVVAMQFSNATVAFGQSSPDTRAPLIELEAVAEAQADAAQVFTAQVVDDRALKDVSLYFRRAGQQPFIPVAMSQIGDSSFYTVSISTDSNDLRAFEYYVQARDENSNRTVEGYAFDPYVRVLTANESLATETRPVVANNTVAEKPSTSSGLRWWHIAAGIALAGVIASAAGGGDSGSDNGTVPLTINLTGL